MGRHVAFDELAPVPHFERPVPTVKRKKTLKSFWMTTDERVLPQLKGLKIRQQESKLTKKMMTKWQRRLLLRTKN